MAEEIIKKQVERSRERAGKREYKRQYYPGVTHIAKNRRKFYDPTNDLATLRSITDEDFLNLIGFRALGERYLSVHPPLEEIGEPEDPMRELVPPSPGARAGDRVTTVVMTDSMYNPLISSYTRVWMYLNRWRGIDSASYSSRCTLEMREREMEQVARVLLESESFDPARDAFRQYGCTGASSRLDKNGLMFDAMRRVEYDEKTGNFRQAKDGFGITLDKPVNLGPTLPEEEKKKRTTTYWEADEESMIAGGDYEILTTRRRVTALKMLAGMGPWHCNGK